jgi:hypothetical protein
MSRNDLKADLLADLTPGAPPPVAAEPLPVPAEPLDLTPVLSLHLTPLRWSRPRVVSVGAGKAVRLGPLSLELNAKP